MLLGMFRASRRGEFATTGSTLENLLGRAPRRSARSSKEPRPRAERPPPTRWPPGRGGHIEPPPYLPLSPQEELPGHLAGQSG
jgi:hypothetical protein